MRYRFENVDTASNFYEEQRTAVTRELGLKKLHNIPISVKDQLASIVTTTALCGSKATKTPIQRYRIHNSKRMERKNVWAEMIVDWGDIRKDRGDRVRLRASFMQEIAEDLQNPIKRIAAIARLKKALYHEIYHSYQVRKTPNAARRSFENGPISNDHKIEVGARLFSIAGRFFEPLSNATNFFGKVQAIKEGLRERVFNYRGENAIEINIGTRTNQ